MRIYQVRSAVVFFGLVFAVRETDSVNLYPSSIIGSIRNVTLDATNLLSDGIQRQTKMMIDAKNTAIDYVTSAVEVPRNMLSRAKNATKNYVDGATSRGMETKFRAIAEFFRGEMPRGIPSLDIPILEPLIIEHMECELHNKNIGDLSSVVDNVTISGLSRFVLDSVKISIIHGLEVRVNISVPIIRAHGLYQVNGTVGSMFPVDGKGPFNLEVRQSNCYVEIHLGYSGSMYVKNVTIDFGIKSSDGKFEHLYEKKSVDDTMNKVIFNVGSEIVDVVKPEVIPELEMLLAQKLNATLADLTMTNVIGIFTTEMLSPKFVGLD